MTAEVGLYPPFEEQGTGGASAAGWQLLAASDEFQSAITAVSQDKPPPELTIPRDADSDGAAISPPPAAVSVPAQKLEIGKKSVLAHSAPFGLSQASKQTPLTTTILPLTSTLLPSTSTLLSLACLLRRNLLVELALLVSANS